MEKLSFRRRGAPVGDDDSLLGCGINLSFLQAPICIYSTWILNLDFNLDVEPGLFTIQPGFWEPAQ